MPDYENDPVRRSYNSFNDARDEHDHEFGNAADMSDGADYKSCVVGSYVSNAVKNSLASVLGTHCDMYAESMGYGLSALTRSIDSPIEQMMFLALWNLCSINHEHVIAKGKDGEHVSVHNPGADFQTYSIIMQHEVGRYKADLFVLLSRNTFYNYRDLQPSIPIVKGVIVECDGHEFHERTKAQASHDKKRDRILQSAGYRVFRYTGSDIMKDPTACALEVLKLLRSEVDVEHEALKTTLASRRAE